MTLDEAQKLIEQVQREEPRICVMLDDENAKTDNRRYRIKVELTIKRRVMLIRQPEEWESVKMAWSHWLPELYQEEEETEPKQKPRVYYLVDGIPMCITLDRGKYWIGNGTVNGKKVRKYLGLTDPRPTLKRVVRSNE